MPVCRWCLPTPSEVAWQRQARTWRSQRLGQVATRGSTCPPTWQLVLAYAATRASRRLASVTMQCKQWAHTLYYHGVRVTQCFVSEAHTKIRGCMSVQEASEDAQHASAALSSHGQMLRRGRTPTAVRILRKSTRHLGQSRPADGVMCMQPASCPPAPGAVRTRKQECDILTHLSRTRRTYNNVQAREATEPALGTGQAGLDGHAVQTKHRTRDTFPFGSTPIE